MSCHGQEDYIVMTKLCKREFYHRILLVSLCVLSGTGVNSSGLFAFLRFMRRHKVSPALVFLSCRLFAYSSISFCLLRYVTK